MKVGKPIGHTSTPEKAQGPQPWVILIFAVMLLALGGAIAWSGWLAIDQRHFELQWESESSFFLVGRTSNGVLLFNGADSVRFGVGLVSFGVMMVIWGGGLAAGFARQKVLGGGLRSLRGLTWLSLVSLLVATICIFPPWQWPSVPFFVVVTLVLTFFFALPDIIGRWKRSRRLFFPGLIVATLVFGSISTSAGTGMAIGIFASLAIVLHAFLLFPQLSERLSIDD